MGPGKQFMPSEQCERAETLPNHAWGEMASPTPTALVSNLACLSVLDFDRGMATPWCKIGNCRLMPFMDRVNPRLLSSWLWTALLPPSVAGRVCDGKVRAGHRAFWSPTAAELSKSSVPSLRDVPEGGFGEGFAMRPSGSNDPSPSPF